MTFIVEVERLSHFYPGRRGGKDPVHAVDDVSFTLGPGESLGLVGESGSGKTTTGRILCGLERASHGRVVVAGHSLVGASKTPRGLYDSVQMVFQDPYLSLDPRRTVADSIGYPLKVRHIPRDEVSRRVSESLDLVGLPARVASRFPRQLSTGQRQRVGIARAMIQRPSLVVADEPVSSLDVSLQTQVLNLMLDIQTETGVSFLFISHDLATVGYVCERVMVMRNGRIVEQGDTELVLASPKTAYACQLVEAAGLAIVDGGGGAQDPASELHQP